MSTDIETNSSTSFIEIFIVLGVFIVLIAAALSLSSGSYFYHQSVKACLTTDDPVTCVSSLKKD
jgi:hypothetical protein